MEPFALPDPQPPVLPDPLPLGRATVDRDGDARADPELIARLLADPGTGVIAVSQASVAVVPDGPQDEPRLALLDPAELADPEWFYLGRDADRGYLAALVGETTDVPTATWGTLRDAGHLLDARDAGLATTAVALAQWRRTHRFCPRCGAPTELALGGWEARCSAEGSSQYPRTDPAVIMAVHDGEGRLLLARSAAWPENRRSVLAGFVEAGEGPEQTVRREVAEEVQLTIGEVRYAGAQTWPFPASLMLGYHAWIDGDPTPPQPDGEEITHAAWFTREELARAVASGEIGLPMRTSIARALIESWFGGEIG